MMKLLEPSCFIRRVKEAAVNKPIILYGAGMDAVWAIEEWRRSFGASFQGCICDGDPQKQRFILDGVKILSPENALEQFPEAVIWVAAKDYKFEIMGQLVYEKGIPEARILNYEPMIQKRGCRYAEKTFFAMEGFDKEKKLARLIHVCCELERPVPTIQFSGYDDLHRSFYQFREQVINTLASAPDWKECQGCSCAKTNYFAAQKKIRTYNLATDGRCNFRCRYCRAPIFSTERMEEIFDFTRALEIFAENDMLSEDLHIDITSGEICVNPYRTQMLDAAFRYAETVSIATNASIFNEQIYELLQSRRASLIVSVDAGTEKTFQYIKNRDYFEKVKNNLVAYGKAGAGSIELKYIVLPGVNDNPTDIEGFVNLCLEVKPAVVTISFDFYYKGQVEKQTLAMVNDLKKQLSENGIFYKYEARASHILRLSDEV